MIKALVDSWGFFNWQSTHAKNRLNFGLIFMLIAKKNAFNLVKKVNKA